MLFLKYVFIIKNIIIKIYVGTQSYYIDHTFCLLFNF